MLEALDTPFDQIAVLLMISALLGLLALRMRQPLVVAFIVVGLVAGPAVLGVVEPDDELLLLSEIGVALVLFVVGLKLDLRMLRWLGPAVFAGGLAQVAVVTGLGVGVATLFGFSALESVYVGLALAFSSTIIVVKLLSDSGQLDELQGKLAVGFLIVQDLVVVVALIALTSLGGDEHLLSRLAVVVAAALGMLLAIFLLARYVLPALLHRLALSGELLVIFAIAWAVTLAAVGDSLDLGKEVGAFLAGVALASTPYREAIGARLTTLRDFLLLFFFVVLGASLSADGLTDHWGALLVLSALVLLVKPLVVMLVLPLLGYRKRVSFLTGVTLAQISEFSLVLVASGLALGHVSTDVSSVVTLVAAVTIFASTFLIVDAERLFVRFERFVPESRARLDHSDDLQDLAPEVVVFGLGRFAQGVVEGLKGADLTVLGVDYDPRALGHWRREIDVVYGDAEDPETPRLLPLRSTRWVVSTVRRADANLALLESLRHHRYGGRVAVAANSDYDAERLLALGADVVLRPYRDAGLVAVGSLSAYDLRHPPDGEELE